MSAPPTALLLIGLGRELDRRVRRGLAGGDLELRQVYVLDALDRLGDLGQRELGGRLGVDHSLLVTMLNPLEAGGLIERRRSEEDRRRHQVAITPAGRRALTKALKTIDATEAELLGGLDAATADRLRLTLWAVRRSTAGGGVPIG